MNPTLLPGYLLDANSVIELGRRMSPPEIRVTANAVVDDLISQGRVLAPLEVCKELEDHANDKGDLVLQWVERHKAIFIELTGPQQAYLADVLKQFPGLVKHDSQGFDADPILVAMAMDYPGWTVVTRDGTGARNRMGVKQACDHFNIPCITEHVMLKDNGWSI